jgi:hypothetical protein
MLLTENDDLKQRVRLNAQMNVSAMMPMVRQAERDYLVPVLGPDLYAALKDEADSSSPDPGLMKVLNAAKDVSAIMGYYLYVPVGQLQMDQTGLHALSNDTFKSPYQWQVGDYREAYLLSGYAAIEHLYTVLEEVKPTAWLNSEACSLYRRSLLRNAREFDRHYRIGYSRITYVDLKPAIERAEDKVLRPVLGDAFYDALVDHLNDANDGSSSDVALRTIMDEAVRRLQKALAPLAVAHATELLFKVVNGSLLSTRFDGNSSNSVKVSDDRLQMEFAATTRANALRVGHEMLALARGYLDRNAESIPLWKEAPGYTPPDRVVPTRIHNAGSITMV